MNARETLAHVAEWLGFQDEHLSSGLKTAFDGLRLYDYAMAHGDMLPEMADDWTPEQRTEALGYDPLSDSYDDGIFHDAKTTGADLAAAAMDQAVKLLDSVAFVSKEGDTQAPLTALREVLTA